MYSPLGLHLAPLPCPLGQCSRWKTADDLSQYSTLMSTCIWQKLLPESAWGVNDATAPATNYPVPVRCRYRLSKVFTQPLLCLQDRGTSLASNQVQYSLLYRTPEQNGVKQACEEGGTSLIAYSPLAQGLLTGEPVFTVPTRRLSRAARHRWAHLQIGASLHTATWLTTSLGISLLPAV